MALALSLGMTLASASAFAAADDAVPLRTSPDVHSQAFYVLDETHSSVLAARHESVPAPIASITKLMTALVVLEAGQPMEELLTITSADVRGTVGGRSRLAPGTRLSRGDLLHLALMSSENRAAHAVCRNYPDGLPACVQAMNDKAAELEMTTTRFVEPTGLSSSNVASPEDLAKLVLAAAGNPTIRYFSTDDSHTVYLGRQALEYRNTNRLVENPAWDVGVQKTGYISKAGRCLVMQTVVDERQVVIVLLNSLGRLTRIADAMRIRTWLESQREAAGDWSSGVSAFAPGTPLLRE
ncbi:MAG TPA: serine hydrolase [Steroidobacteraceae bacterium]|nr:serine hydrolase [Steroidobacteraceae bacterium]